MKKRGQISLFILLGIAAVIIISVLFSQKAAIQEEPKPVFSSDVAPIRLFSEQCFERVAEDAVVSAGYQGARAVLYEDDNFLELPDFYTSYGYYEGNDNTITKEEAESLISQYVQEEVLNCIGNYSNFVGQKITPEVDTPIVNTSLLDSRVEIVMNYPIAVEQQEKKTEVTEPYRAVLNVRLKHMMEIEKELVSQTAQHPDLINMDYLSSLDLNTTAVTYGNDSVIYILKDEKSKIGNLYVLYVFAAKLGARVSNSGLKMHFDSGVVYTNISFDREYEAPVIINAQDLSVNVGEILDFDFDAISPKNRTLTYSVKSDLADLVIDSKTGKIRYLAKQSDIGANSAYITVIDTEGYEDVANIFITVAPNE